MIFNTYTSEMIGGDEEINGNASLLDNSNLHIITPDVKRKLDENKDIASVGYVYFTSSTHKMDDILYDSIKQSIKERGGMDTFSEPQQKEIKDCLKKREVKSHVMGINKAAFDKMNFGKESCTWKDFASGKYVITYAMYYPSSYYSVGDKVSVEFNDKKIKEYKVIVLPIYPLHWTTCINLLGILLVVIGHHILK